MDFFQLETFLAVAQTGSFSTAATQVHRTQPAVSQMVRKLEEEVGEALFDRSTRDGMLTDAGRVLVEYAQKHHMPVTHDFHLNQAYATYEATVSGGRKGTSWPRRSGRSFMKL